MRIINLIIILLACFSLNIYGQKSKSEIVTLKQLHLPLHPLSNQIRTYALDCSSDYELIPNYSEPSLEIKGYERTSIENADVVVRLKILNGNSFPKSITKVKRSNNKIIEVKMNIPIDSEIAIGCVLVDKEGYNIHNVHYPNYEDITQTTYTTLVTTSTDIETAFKEYSDNAINHALKITLNKVRNATQEYLNKHFSYYTEEIEFKIFTGKSNKFDYSDLDEALINFQKAAKLYSENELTSEVKIILDECITTWNMAINEYKPNIKKARISNKNIAQIYHNLSVAYYLLDQFDDALKSAEKEIIYGAEDTLIDRIIERKNAVNMTNKVNI
ncbi:MAG: hypothetical protein GQ564_20650 [Bacteroidales bacterium]|nr:hypothetical protein [Bacteroidales bacterium]